MATINFRLPEILKIIQANSWEPVQIEDLKAEGNKAWFKLKTKLKICETIDVAAEFIGFERNMAIIHITTNWLIDKIMKMLGKKVIQQNLNKYCIDLNGYPKITIDINKMLTDKIKGIQIKDITFKDGLFTLIT